MIDGWGISCEIALRWMPLDLTDDKSILAQVMAWCRQATSHYLSQCWPRSLLMSLGPDELNAAMCLTLLFVFVSSCISITIQVGINNYVTTNFISWVEPPLAEVLEPVQWPTTAWINADLSSLWPSETNLSEIGIKIFFQAITFENAVCKTAAILFWPQCVKSSNPRYALWYHWSWWILAAVMHQAIT